MAIAQGHALVSRATAALAGTVVVPLLVITTIADIPFVVGVTAHPATPDLFTFHKETKT
jgi:hypothetical protein